MPSIVFTVVMEFINPLVVIIVIQSIVTSLSGGFFIRRGTPSLPPVRSVKPLVQMLANHTAFHTVLCVIRLDHQGQRLNLPRNPHNSRV
jgi:hypothetical protein